MNYPATISFFLGVLTLSVPAQTFTSPGLGTDLESPPDLVLQNFQFTESLQPDMRILVEVAADLQNIDSGQWRDAGVTLTAPESGLSFEVVDPELEFGPIPAHTTVSPDSANSSFAALVSASEVAAFREALEAGEFLTVSGFEFLVFSAQPRPFDADTANLWQSVSGGTLIFAEDTSFLSSLVPGQLLVEDLNVHNLPNPRTKNPLNPNAPDPPRVLAEFLPFEVTSVADVNGEIHVSGATRQLMDVLMSATIIQTADEAQPGNRPYYDPPLENTYTEEEQEEREELALMIAMEDPQDPRLPALRGLSATPIKFSDVEITPKLRISGEVLLQSSGLGLDVKIRNFEVQRVAVDLTGGLVLNAVIDVGEPEDNTSAPEEDKSLEITRLSLPPVVISIAGAPIALQPVFTVTVGAEVATPTRLSIPLQSAVLVGLEAGWDKSLPEGDRFFYTPTHDHIPLRVSDPSVFDEVAVTASAFAEAAIEVYMGTPPAPQVFGPSTGLAIRTTAEATVAPLSAPWWEMDFSLDLSGRFGFNLLGVDVLDTDVLIASVPLFHRDSGGPLALPDGGEPSVGLDAFEAKTGRGVRWARVYQPFLGSGGNESGFVFVLPGAAGEILSVNINDISHALTKFTAEGDFIWSKDFAVGDRPRAGVPEPGGGFTITGINGAQLWLASFDSDGERLWFTSLTPGINWLTEDLLRIENDLGQAEYFLAGHVSSSGVRASDPAVLKFDAAGNLLWARHYALDGDHEPRSLIRTSDGGIILCGVTTADVAAPPEGSPNPDVIGHNASSNLLLMKINDEGSLQWAKTYVCGGGSSLQDLCEAPDGTIYACGQVSRSIRQTRPANLVAHFAADGTLLDHVLVGDDPDYPDDLPNGGNTPYDVASSITWCENSLFLCGGTSLGALRSAWVASLTAELGVRYYTYLDGPSLDDLVSLECSRDGLLLAGQTSSTLPWGTGGEAATLLVSLPFEGTMNFQEVSGLGMEYMQPQVFHSSADTAFQVSSTIPGSPPITLTNNTSEVPFVATELSTSPGTAMPGLGNLTPARNVAVGDLDPGAIVDFPSWAAFFQIPAGQDAPNDNHDGDARINGEEFYFGGRPFAPDSDPVDFGLSFEGDEGDEQLVLEFVRSSHATGLAPLVFASTDLELWDLLTAPDSHTITSSAWGDDGDQLIRIRIPTEGFPRRFVEVAPPALAP